MFGGAARLDTCAGVQVRLPGCRLVAVSLVDAHLCADPGKYLAALLLSLATMLHLELPQVCSLPVTCRMVAVLCTTNPSHQNLSPTLCHNSMPDHKIDAKG